MRIYPFEEVINDEDVGYAHICPDCAKKWALETSDTCINGNYCLVERCNNKTSLVHYIWDNRPEIVECRRRNKTA